MKVCMFHLMPYRDLGPDFDQHYKSAYIDPVWFDVADPDKVGQYYNWTLDEMVYAARAGMHGLCTNQHHQNVYGFMANPSLMGSALAKLTNGLNVAIIQIGSTLPSTSPPTRIAEEYAMIDCLSGGRLVAGFPTGLPTDATISNGVVPVEQRERYREALQLVLKAWQAREVFAWNGRHYQLPMVNLWPRPIQQPHPPIWIPGSGSATTVEFVVDRDDCFCHLSYFGAKNAETLGDYYWDTVARLGREANPYRLGFLQLIGVSESDAAAEEYSPHVEYFFHKLLYTPQYYQAIPGYQDHPSLVRALRAPLRERFDLRGAQVQGFHRARLFDCRKCRDSPRPADRRHQAAAHRPPAGTPAFRLDASRAVPKEYRSVLPRCTASPRRHLGRRMAGPLVARATTGRALRPVCGGLRILMRRGTTWRR